jgi:O-succinylbenzoate synthase
VFVSSSSSVVHQSVRIESIVLHRVRIPFVEPFQISNGVVAEKESILIEATSDDGVVGWGECSPMSGSFYSADTPDSSWQVLLELIPRLFELGAMKPNDVYQQLREFPAMRLRKLALRARCGMFIRGAEACRSARC